MSWIDGRRMVPTVGGSPAEVDRQLGWPHVTARREGVSSCLLQWVFPAGTPEDFPETWEWRVQRSGSPGGPFEDQSNWLSSAQSTWRDDALPLGPENTRRPYYRLVFRLNGEEVVLGYAPEWDALRPSLSAHGFTWEELGVRTAYSPPVVREVRRRFSVLSREFAGVVAALYRPAWLAPACGACTNLLTGEQSGEGDRGVCSSCLGTGKAGGYYTPLRVEVMRQGGRDMSARSIPQGSHDLVEARQAVLPWWPIPESGDLLRFRDGSLYLISNLHPLEGYQFPVAYMARDLTQIPRTHPVNTLPMPSVLRHDAVHPRRQFGRAMNLDAFRGSMAEGTMARAGGELPDPSE